MCLMKPRHAKTVLLPCSRPKRVPYVAHLPLIATEAESTRRTTEQFATRAMALCVVAVKGEGLEQEIIDSLIKEHQLESAFTRKSRSSSRTQSVGTRPHPVRVALRVLLGDALGVGLHRHAGTPDTICDVSRAVSFLRDNGRDGFLKKAKLRSQSEILDAADLIYRYHWAVVDARINNREAPAGLDGGIVMERHYALNWLMGLYGPRMGTYQRTPNVARIGAVDS